jgi:hypothetical protein
VCDKDNVPSRRSFGGDCDPCGVEVVLEGRVGFTLGGRECDGHAAEVVLRGQDVDDGVVAGGEVPCPGDKDEGWLGGAGWLWTVG